MGKWIIDLPGYGFARVSPQEKELWQTMIENCIAQRKSRKTVYIIIDAYVGPTELDFDMAFWLEENGAEYKVVANKCDKLPSEVSLVQVCQKAAELFNIKEDEVFAVSAKQKNGFEKLKADIAGFLK
jgi:GTP-binding protein